MKTLRKWLLFSGLAALIVSCATSTELRKTWSDPSLTGNPVKPFKKVLILAKVKKEETRRTVEDQLVSQIRNGEAIQSYIYLMPSDTSQKMVVEKLIKDGFDGVITMRLKGVVQTKTKSSNPGTSYANWYGYSYGYGYGYGYGVGVAVDIGPKESGGPETVDVNSAKDYIIETNIYSLEKKMLLWSGVTASMSAKKIEPALNGIVNTVRKELKKKGFLSSDSK